MLENGKAVIDETSDIPRNIIDDAAKDATSEWFRLLCLLRWSSSLMNENLYIMKAFKCKNAFIQQ